MLLLRSPVIFHEDTTFFCSRASRVISAAIGSPLTGMFFGISVCVFLCVFFFFFLGGGGGCLFVLEKKLQQL